MAKYVDVSVLVRGIARENGKKRTCMYQACGRMATVRARRTTPKSMTVVYCEEHARLGGILKS